VISAAGRGEGQLGLGFKGLDSVRVDIVEIIDLGLRWSRWSTVINAVAETLRNLFAIGRVGVSARD
jgi:hypothetical protein